MVQASHRLVHQMHLVSRLDGLHLTLVRLVHQAIRLCHHMDTIRQAHHPLTHHRVQTINHLDPYQIIRQTARTTHQRHQLMVRYSCSSLFSEIQVKLCRQVNR